MGCFWVVLGVGWAWFGCGSGVVWARLVCVVFGFLRFWVGLFVFWVAFCRFVALGPRAGLPPKDPRKRGRRLLPRDIEPSRTFSKTTWIESKVDCLLQRHQCLHQRNFMGIPEHGRRRSSTGYECPNEHQNKQRQSLTELIIRAHVGGQCAHLSHPATGSGTKGAFVVLCVV